MTGTRPLPLTTTTRTRAHAGAGLLLAGTALLTGCGAQPGEIPLSEIRAESPSAVPTAEPAVANATPGVIGAAAPALPVTAHNGLIASRVFLDPGRLTSAVFTVTADGTALQQLTRPPGDGRDDHPDWSPDGSTIAFDRTETENGTARLWTVSADGEGAHPLGQLCEPDAADCTNEQESGPAFSPDGKQIAFSRAWGAIDPSDNKQIQYSDLYLMSPDGTNAQRLTFLTNDKPYSGDVRNPSWSPDGKQLVFEYRTSTTGQPAAGRALYVVNADGTGLRRLTPWELRAGERASWSPDGTRIVFTTYPAGPDYSPGGGIYTVQPDGSTIDALTPGPSNVFYGAAAYSPDGTSIVFAQAPAGGTADLYRMQANGTGVTRITDTADQWESRPSWGTAAPRS
ncbi:TolB family protein [Kitasatospora sp. NPDC059327]|uniref:TolB family protein n=1 Tax=Kitasatospora sp. NPDC059327 TaxID=3346803 RepID=UPI00369D5028